ncbi:hypothetical protein ACRQ5D_10735 [Mucilaginibacter sp. P25]|uniref:hypothetical protein n=1 Tax=Mucilaginibacter sp. P25 TaxID=3423945 RepID=UPI003D7AE84E
MNLTQVTRLAVTNSFHFDNGIKVVHAIQALQYLNKHLNEKLIEYGKSKGYDNNKPTSEIASFIENLNVEELF